MDVFVARQPILGPKREVAAYELLYRSSDAVDVELDDADLATSKLLVNACATLGVGTLTSGRPAYIGFTREGLLADYPSLVPASHLYVELLESVQPDNEVVEACRRLGEQGYQVALDGVTQIDRRFSVYVEEVDVVKVDFAQADPDTRRQAAEVGLDCGAKLLADEVDTEDAAREAADLGYSLFQGYFFQKPNVVSGRQLDPSQRSRVMLLRAIQAPVLDRNNIESIIKSDFSISYELLKYLNSAAFAWRRPITDIKQAMVALGERELRKWISVLCLGSIAKGKPAEVLVQSVVRGLFCESVAPLVNLQPQANELFLVGLFSLLDAIMDRPLSECLSNVPVSEPTSLALFEDRGPYAPVLNLTRAIERGDWTLVRQWGDQLRLRTYQLAEPWISAVRRGDDLLRGD